MNELIKVNPSEYGLEEPKADELTVGLNVTLKERINLISEFNDLSKVEVTEQSISKFKELRLRIVKNRTQGILVWHRDAKNYFLRGGQFVDAIKRKEVAVNDSMEEKLKSAESYFVNLERERIKKLQDERAEKLSKFEMEYTPTDLGTMSDEIWKNYISGVKLNFEDRKEAERVAEIERIEKEKAEEEAHLAIIAENAMLKKEADERERVAKIEADKRAKAESERIATEEAERKAREAKAEKERKEYEAKLRIEREEKERIQREAKEKADKLEAELKAKEDADRKAREKKAEQERLEYEAKLNAERKENERIQAELKAKQEAERKAEQERLESIEYELNKGDAEKVKDLINDLLVLQTKYSFKSAKNKKMYIAVCELIIKVVNYINN